jgi:hypothetical protein
MCSRKNKSPLPEEVAGIGGNSLTMSYFHTGIRTIIGAESFHCPVRDGKEWDQLAMVIRLNWLLPRSLRRGQPIRRVVRSILLILRNQRI